MKLTDLNRHLKAVELSIAEDTVIVLVRDVKYSAEGSDTRGLQLQENIPRTRAKSLLQRTWTDEGADGTWPHLFVLRVIQRRSGVKNRLLCIVEQLWNVFQVLGRTLEWEKWAERLFQKKKGMYEPDNVVMCVRLSGKVSRCDGL